MVLGIHPEERNRRYSPSPQFLGDANGSERFIRSVEWPRKKPHLLARDDGDATIVLQVPDILHRSRGRPKAFVLALQHAGDLAARGLEPRADLMRR